MMGSAIGKNVIECLGSSSRLPKWYALLMYPPVAGGLGVTNR
jgi:hypothetical protein